MLRQVVRQLPNMVTNPCKKGTYGVFGTYLGYKKVAPPPSPPPWFNHHAYLAPVFLSKSYYHFNTAQGYKGASGEFECVPHAATPLPPSHVAVQVYIRPHT